MSAPPPGGRERSDWGIKPGIVVIDKPSGMTSHDVVNRARRIFGTRRVGHAGTLDPMATGVLVVGIERATKILGLLTTTAKSYTGTIRLGQTTTTDDAEGEVVAAAGAEAVGDAAIVEAVGAFRGDIEQVPSKVSAVKVGGKRAYHLARTGEEVKLAPRAVRVDRFDITGIRRVTEASAAVIDLDVEVDCSSGTYIRALARDLGAALGVGGHLTALRRTRVGGFGLDHAHPLDDLTENPQLSYSLDEACLLTFPRRELVGEETAAATHGRSLPAAGIEGVYAAVDPAGRVIALLRDEAARTKSVVVVRPATL